MNHILGSSYPSEFTRRLFALSVAAVFAGCATNTPRYANGGPPKPLPDCKQGGAHHSEGNASMPAPGTPNSVRKPPGQDYSLAFVEFGEHGSFQDPTQLDEALKVIRRARRPLVITYLHGWHNHSGSDDVCRFMSFLAGLTNVDTIKAAGFDVIGVYLGWRGESSSIPVLNSLTFWNRKAAAERLAANYDCLDAISALSAEARRKGAAQNYTVLLGHSFGGLVVERSVAHSISTSLHSGSARSLPADLIVTLNPASDAILTRQMIASFDSSFSFDGAQYVGRRDPAAKFPGNRQVIATISADNDRATGMLFPIGSNVGNATQRWDRVAVPGQANKARSERTYYTSTPGNNKDLITHRVVEIAKNPTHKHRNALDENLNRGADGRFYTSETNTPDEDPGDEEWRLWKFTRASAVQTPYWIIQVPRDIINDHGGIWSDNSQALIGSLFRMNFPLRAAAGRAAPAPSTPASFKLPATRAFERTEVQQQ